MLSPATTRRASERPRQGEKPHHAAKPQEHIRSLSELVSLTAAEADARIAASVAAVAPGTAVRVMPVADGGEGTVLAAAADLGCRRIVLGLGGVACTDGGAGMAQGLGACLLDGSGRAIPPGGAALASLRRLELGPLAERISGIEFVAALDVDNPLLGGRAPQLSTARRRAPRRRTSASWTRPWPIGQTGSPS
jgi:glycerate kinase